MDVIGYKPIVIVIVEGNSTLKLCQRKKSLRYDTAI